jgi:gamma-glutamyltranspeptidase/glutathione hydrolase
LKDLTKRGYEKDHDWIIDGCRVPEEGEIYTTPVLAKYV